MFDVLYGLGADGVVTAYDWSSLDLTGITNTANSIATVAIPVIVTVALIPIGVKLFKRLISKV